jgi:hypothetical protein
MGDGRVRVEIIKEGSETIVKADRDGFRYVAGICESLAETEYDEQRPTHFHIDPS